MKHLYSILVLLSLLFSSNSFGLTVEQSNVNFEKNNSKKINLPSDTFFKKRFITEKDSDLFSAISQKTRDIYYKVGLRQLYVSITNKK